MAIKKELKQRLSINLKHSNEIIMQHLFFQPTISKFQAIAEDGFIVNSNEHRLVSLEKSFLGVKSCIYYSSDLIKKHPLDKSDVFVLNHKESHDLAALLYESMTNKKGQVFEHFETNNWDWAAFLFKDINYSLGDFTKSNRMTELFEPINKDFDDHSIFDNLNIVIGVNNGYDANDGTTFYALIQHRKYPKGSFLTIDNFHFSIKHITEYFIKGKKTESLNFVIGYDVSNKFSESIHDFANDYAFLFNHYFNDIEREFIPICLDIHNINRSVTSMENDSNLRNNARILIDKCLKFLKNTDGRIDYALLVDFLLSYSEFDLDEIRFNRRRVEEIFITKRAYKNLITRLTKTLVNPKNHYDYLNDQIGSYLQIKGLV
jgi:hypothetical protein